MRAAVRVRIAGIAVVAIGIASGCNEIIGLKPGIGRCEGVTCPAPDECHVQGACDPQTGKCSEPTKEDGTICDDHDVCTMASACQGGICKGQDRLDCPSPAGACHVQGACDPETGCFAADGTSCDDGNVCTDKDTCQAGICSSGSSEHRWAHWDLHEPPPSPRFAYTADVVFDRLTGLTWQRNVPADAPADSWQAALDYCKNTFNLPGYPSGWRLPTRIELTSLVDYTKAGPAIDPEAFPGLKAEPTLFFWTSSSFGGALAWIVSFQAGYVGLGDKAESTYRARCVR